MKPCRTSNRDELAWQYSRRTEKQTTKQESEEAKRGGDNREAGSGERTVELSLPNPALLENPFRSVLKA